MRRLMEDAARSFWKEVTPRPRSRTLILGATGSGKSTLGCTLLESYHEQHPRDVIYIMDPKERFVPRDNDSTRLFPDGPTARIHGRVEGVAVNAVLLRNPYGFRWDHERCFLVQDWDKITETLDYLWANHDVRRPVMVYNDESLELHNEAARIHPSMRRLIQMGREKGLGHITISQRPMGIGKTLRTETDKLFIGCLFDPGDLKAVSSLANVPPEGNGITKRSLLAPVRQRYFTYIDQHDQSKNRVFTVKT